MSVDWICFLWVFGVGGGVIFGVGVLVPCVLVLVGGVVVVTSGGVGKLEVVLSSIELCSSAESVCSPEVLGDFSMTFITATCCDIGGVCVGFVRSGVVDVLSVLVLGGV